MNWATLLRRFKNTDNILTKEHNEYLIKLKTLDD